MPDAPLPRTRQVASSSRRDAFRRSLALAVLALATTPLACGGGGGGSDTPTDPAPTCTSLAGTWQHSWLMPPCGPTATGSGTVTVSQAGCAVSIAVPGLGTFAGTIVPGDRQAQNFQLAFDAAAPGSPTCIGSGSAGLDPFTANRLDFVFGDNTPDCCRHGALHMQR